MFQMIRFLSKHVELDLVAPQLEGATEAERLLASSCRQIEFVPQSQGTWSRRFLRLGPYETDPVLSRAVARRLATENYGAVQVEKPAMLPYLPRTLGIPIILDLWAYGLAGAWRALWTERGLGTRARNLLRLVRFGAYDAFCWPATHCLLVVSEIDRQRCLRSRRDRRVQVVPNGVDCKGIRPTPTPSRGARVIMFTGDMSFAPNIEAAVLLCREIFPSIRRSHPEVQLHIVGRNPAPRILECRVPGVVVTGTVPDMLVYLQRATVYVAPHFTGAGTRTKLLEAMAAGLPIVTTTIGLEGIAAHPGREIMVGDTRAELLALVRQLLDDQNERRRLGEAARRLVEARYDWSQCLAPLEQLYAGLCKREAATC
jgi:glycosyltransferase involved in cell wall biosynthesis